MMMGSLVVAASKVKQLEEPSDDDIPQSSTIQHSVSTMPKISSSAPPTGINT